MVRRLEVGMKAPALEGMTPRGEKFSLAESRGLPVWLAFYRYAGCPLCNLHLYESSLWLDSMPRSDLKMIAVFESAGEKFEDVGAWDCSVPLTLISDPEKKHYETFGVDARLLAAFTPVVVPRLIRALRQGFRQGPIGGELGQVPGHFLIDETGVIEQAYYGRHIDDHMPWPTIQAFVEKRAGAGARSSG